MTSERLSACEPGRLSCVEEPVVSRFDAFISKVAVVVAGCLLFVVDVSLIGPQKSKTSMGPVPTRHDFLDTRGRKRKCAR